MDSGEMLGAEDPQMVGQPYTLTSPGVASPSQRAPEGEGYTRHPRPRPQRRDMRVQIVMEGWLKKKASHGFGGFKPWQPRYFVLFANSREIRYYGSVVESLYGNLPLDERGSIPLEYITAITVPEVDTHGGRRLDVHTARFGEHAYPRDINGIATSGTGITAAQTKLVTRIFSLEAPTIHDRIAWVRALRELTGLGGSTRSSADAAASPGGATLYSYAPNSTGTAGSSPQSFTSPVGGATGAATSAWPVAGLTSARRPDASAPSGAPPPLPGLSQGGASSHGLRQMSGFVPGGASTLPRFSSAPPTSAADSDRGHYADAAMDDGLREFADEDEFSQALSHTHTHTHTQGARPPAHAGAPSSTRAARQDWEPSDSSAGRRARSSDPATSRSRDSGP